jgi:hypothetical protein
LQKLWLDLRKDVTAKVAIVNQWLATYQNLFNLLTNITGQSEVKTAIDRLIETEQSIARFYETDVQVHALGEDLVKLSGTKQQFDRFMT